MSKAEKEAKRAAEKAKKLAEKKAKQAQKEAEKKAKLAAEKAAEAAKKKAEEQAKIAAAKAAEEARKKAEVSARALYTVACPAHEHFILGLLKFYAKITRSACSTSCLRGNDEEYFSLKSFICFTAASHSVREK